MHQFPRLFLLLFTALLSACSAKIVNFSVYEPFDLSKRIAIIPFTNNTTTPLAGEQAMSITAGVLKSKGVRHLRVYVPPARKNEILPGMARVDSQKALVRWARSIHADYVFMGQVNEWTYKVGLDGEPVVGVAIQLMDLHRQRIVFSAVGSESEGNRVAVSTAAQRLINDLVQTLFYKR